MTADPSPPATTTSLAEYIFARLCQLGVKSIFGVPGDYNLRLLDFVEPCSLHWVGNCNELNAAYAADGYARINGISALITTFGVGELSAINGIAGAYAEKAPVIHIVGTPPRPFQDSRTLMHHTFADGDYRRFAAMHAHVTVAQTNLVNPQMAPEQVDATLQQALIHSRPVYIEIPDDMVDARVGAERLQRPIPARAHSLNENKHSLVSSVLEKIYSAKQPLIMVDGESRALKILDELDQLVQTTGWPTWTTPFGKGLVNEQLPNVRGIYTGSLGNGEYKSYFESADLILNFGPHLSDTNTQHFTTIPRQEASISFSADAVEVGNKIFRDIPSKWLLLELLEKLDQDKIPKILGPAKFTLEPFAGDMSDLLTQKDFYIFMNSMFRTGDIVLTETGTAAHGGRNFVLPPHSRFFTAVTWLSIGYMLPATLGAALAQRDSKRSDKTKDASERVVLFIGDGSLQMTVQELSTMIRENLNVIIILINNNGYTIERAIHGRKQAYNDVASWRNLQALSFLGADEEHAARSTFSARTWRELDQAMKSEQFQNGEGLRILEVFMEQEDCQGALLNLLNAQIGREK